LPSLICNALLIWPDHQHPRFTVLRTDTLMNLLSKLALMP
jgi:hypothetical protein